MFKLSKKSDNSNNDKWKIDKARDYENNYKISTLILYFFSFSIVGFVIEFIYNLIKNHSIENVGLLTGPYIVIYGFIGVIILLISRHKKIRKLFKNYIFTFVFTFVFGSILQYLSSFYLQVVTKVNLIDYSKNICNLNGRICLEQALIYGVVGCLIVYLIFPFMKRFVIDKTIVKEQKIISVVLVILFIVDIIYSNIIGLR